MSIEDAIAVLEVEVAGLQGSKEDTREWWLLRARATGLSLLRKIKQERLTLVQAEVFRKGVRKGLMQASGDDPIPVPEARVEEAQPAVVNLGN